MVPSIPLPKICYHVVLNNFSIPHRSLITDVIALIACVFFETCSYANASYIFKKICCLKIDPIKECVYVHTIKIIQLWCLCSHEKNKLSLLLNMNSTCFSWTDQERAGLLDQRVYYTEIVQDDHLFKVFKHLKDHFQDANFLIMARKLFQHSLMKFGQIKDLSHKIFSQQLICVDCSTWDEFKIMSIDSELLKRIDVNPELLIVPSISRLRTVVAQEQVDRLQTQMYQSYFDSLRQVQLQPGCSKPLWQFISVIPDFLDRPLLSLETIVLWAKDRYQEKGIEELQAYRQAVLLAAEFQSLEYMELHDVKQLIMHIKESLGFFAELSHDESKIKYAFKLTPQGYCMSYKLMLSFHMTQGGSKLSIPCDIELDKVFDYKRFSKTGIVDLQYRILGVNLEQLQQTLIVLEELGQA